MSRTSTPTPVVNALDIETDTRTDGLDPRVSRIVAVAVAQAAGDTVFDEADEAVLLRRLDTFLSALEPGVLATWNGAAFDLPYLADRAATLGVSLGLRLVPDHRARRRRPLAGHQGSYRAAWYRQHHLDAFVVYRSDVAVALRMSASLKAIAGLAGLTPVRVDTAHLHHLRADEVRAYVASDARCTRQLVLRRWATMAGAVDRLDDVTGSPDTATG